MSNTKKDFDSSFWRGLANKMRRKRFSFFTSLITTLPRPLHILDVGGTQEFWERMYFSADDVKIVLYNLAFNEDTDANPNITHIVGDARDMQTFKDKEFDIIFSNSVIEHVGVYKHQQQMAQEVQRVGKKYFVQTPNRFFPIEPHVLLPFFEFFPFGLKVFILAHFRTPWGYKLSGKEEAITYIRGIRLLSEKELRSFFPGARIYKEKFLGLTKSFIVYNGW